MNSLVRRTINYLNHRVIHPLDVRFIRNANLHKDLKPIFIIGAPRSGSTLLSQILISAFDLGYFSNLHAFFFGSPGIPQNVLGTFLRYRDTNFNSHYGDVTGLLSPSECGEYWYRFFQRNPQYVRLEDTEPVKMDRFQQSLARFLGTCGKPVLFKNMLVALRLGPVIKYFPDSLFIIIKRNEFDNAQSLLEARLKINGNIETWWSMEPPGIDEIRRMDPPQQVVEQIRGIHNTIETDLHNNNVGKDQILYVNYEDFCSDIHNTLRRFESFCYSNSLLLKRSNNVPSSFSTKKHPSLPIDLLNRLKDIIDNEQRYC